MESSGATSIVFSEDHAGRLGVVAKNHVCTPLGGIDDARRIRHAGARGDFLDRVTKDLRLLVLVVNAETFLDGRLQLRPTELLQLLYTTFINGVDRVDHLEARLSGQRNSDLLTRDVVDVAPALLHAVHVLR